MPRKTFAALLCLLCLCAEKPAGYVNDFEKAEVGSVPEDLMVLSGAFAVVSVDGNKTLELAGDPLDSYGLLFGPAGMIGGDASGRIWGQSTGRRFPEFGIGVDDAGGYKIWVIPGQARVELRKGEVPKASIPYRNWKPGTWTRLRVAVKKLADNQWKIEGWAWPDGSPPPQAPTLSAEDIQQPAPGRASVWGTPYSGQPIRFDDMAFSSIP